MHLKTVYVRFYKSFNFDYLRKFDTNVTRHEPWESVDGLWYPFVSIPIDRAITTVVGANESGKTHLLTTIEKGISGDGIERADFCRHSRFFTVEAGKMRWPDFGFEWSAVSAAERQAIANACGVTKGASFDSFHIFRTGKDNLTVYLPNGEGFSAHPVSAGATASFAGLLPSVFRLLENVGLPESAPIRWLADDKSQLSHLERLSRKRRVSMFESAFSNSKWFSTKESVTQSADDIAKAFSVGTGEEDGALDVSSASGRRLAELQLAHDLIRKVAKIDAEALKELFEALRDGRDAFANSIIDAINAALGTVLNFPHWWVQDRHFQLLVSPRDYDLVFTICDRTGREYSFGERSSGLKYFLSYYIQYLAHQPPDGRPEILLMDEPDAFLSSQGQQDLLKVFDAFVRAELPGRTPTQIVYVTHSPFLIDKNHGERLRVLEKGVGEEGTRVVRDASRNHYEPLRSAFGSFVAETTFIGHCNLMVEGPADQILLAGAAAFLRAHEASELETLDLNKITIVPAGGEGHIPYLVYLARGRDVEKPAVIVLLDSDTGGSNAKKGLQRGGARGKQLLKPDHVLQVGDLSAGEKGLKNAVDGPLVEIEDLIPLVIALEAAKRYLVEFCHAAPDETAKLTEAAVLEAFPAGGSLFDALKHCFAGLSNELHIEKVGFARKTLDVVNDLSRTASNKTDSKEALTEFQSRMKVLFRKLRQMQRAAERELNTEKVTRRVERAKQAFLQDHPTDAKREQAFVLLEEIESALGDSEEGDPVRIELGAIRRDFKIDDDVLEPIPDYPRFKDRLERLQYAAKLSTQESEGRAFGLDDGDGKVVSNGQTAASSLPTLTVPETIGLETVDAAPT